MASKPKWLYEGKKGVYYPFEPQTQTYLEDHKQAKAQKCKLTINNELYDIDLEKMKQTKRSDQTKVRKIKRELIPVPVIPSQPILSTMNLNPMMSAFAAPAQQQTPQFPPPQPMMQVAPQAPVAAAPTVRPNQNINRGNVNVYQPGGQLYLSDFMNWNVTTSVRNLIIAVMAMLLACVISSKYLKH